MAGAHLDGRLFHLAPAILGVRILVTHFRTTCAFKRSRNEVTNAVV